jgi:hypothetical protein
MVKLPYFFLSKLPENKNDRENIPYRFFIGCDDSGNYSISTLWVTFNL